MNFLNRSRSDFTCRSSTPMAAPTFSTTLSGCPSICAGDPGLAVTDTVEGHDAGVRRAVRALPRDPLVWVLLGDLGVELPLDAVDGRRPVGVRVVDLPDALDAAHELREGLELRPLLLRGRDGHVVLDRFDDSAHG